MCVCVCVCGGGDPYKNSNCGFQRGGGGGGVFLVPALDLGIFKQENIYEYLFEHKETMRSDLLSPTICKVMGGVYFTCICIGK